MATAAAKNGKKTAAVKNRIAEVEPRALVIQPLNVGKLKFKLVGKSPLVVHNFDKKSREQMLEQQTGKKTKTKKEPRCPEEEFLQSFYWVEGEPPAPEIDENGVKFYKDGVISKAIKTGVFGIPLSGFKNALISACRNTDLKMTQIRQAIFVEGPKHHLYAIIEGTPEMHAGIVRLQNKTPMERFRPMWEEWSTEIIIEYDRNQITADQVANLLAIAGYYVGHSEGRPEKSALGWGRWEISE